MISISIEGLEDDAEGLGYVRLFSKRRCFSSGFVDTAENECSVYVVFSVMITFRLSEQFGFLVALKAGVGNFIWKKIDRIGSIERRMRRKL